MRRPVLQYFQAWKAWPFNLAHAAIILATVAGLVGMPEVAGAQAVPPPPPAPSPPPPPPSPPPRAVQVYVAVNGQTTGPFALAELQRMVSAGQLTRQSLVWMEGMAAWMPAGDVPALAALFGGADQGSLDPERFIVGDWHFETPQPVEIPMPYFGTYEGRLMLSMSYRDNKSASAYGTLDAVIDGRPLKMTITGQGTYRISQVDGTGPGATFLLTPQMAYSMSSPGLQTRDWIEDQPVRVTIVDADTLKDDAGVISVRGK